MKQQIKKRGFSLAELLIAVVVATLVIKGVSMSTVNAMILNDYNRGFSIAMNVARMKLEEAVAKKTDFSTIISETGTLSSTVDGIAGLWRIDVTDTIPGKLKDINVSVCWQNRGKRIVGACEDSNNDGTIDKWKDPLPNPPSPCTLSAAVALR